MLCTRGQRDMFLPGYKSSTRKKVVKFGVAISCGKKFALEWYLYDAAVRKSR